MDEKSKRKHAKKQFSELGVGVKAGVENGAMLTTYFFQIYFRMHHFVVKFSSPQAARGHWPNVE